MDKTIAVKWHKVKRNCTYLGVLLGVLAGELAGVYLEAALVFSFGEVVVVVTVGDLQLPCLSARPGLFSLLECGWRCECRPFRTPSISLAERNSDSLSDAADDMEGESLACQQDSSSS